MTAYEVRVQIQTDDNRFFDHYGFRHMLAVYASQFYGVREVTVNGQRYVQQDGGWGLEGDECMIEPE
jgi:hypothetical protein